MDKCTEFCLQVLMLVSGLAFIKSVDFIMVGAILNVLQTFMMPSLANITISSADLATNVTGAELYINTWLFMLITGPVLLIVSLLGLFGAKLKHRVMLCCFIALQVLLLIAVIALSVTRIPAPLVSPVPEWQPLTNFILAGVIIVCAVQGIMIIFSMAAISSLRDEQKVQPPPKSSFQSSPSRRISRVDRRSSLH